jgi:hypothetical protein
MKVAVICEYSGTVRDAFTRLGHDATSFDILPTETPGKHVQEDIMNLPLEYWNHFDLAICHPPCTYLTVTGNKWFYHPDDNQKTVEERRPHPRFPNRKKDREEAVKFFMHLANLPIEKIAIENPVGVMSSLWRKPDQIIQPYEFGHKEAKKTCLWLKNLPKLQPTETVEPEYTTFKSGKRMATWYAESAKLPKHERMKLRSKTFQGIADAIAEQWGGNNALAFDIINDYLKSDEKSNNERNEENEQTSTNQRII